MTSCPATHPTLSTFRATLSCKRTALFCRLPLPTLFYRPEAAHLGDLLRLLVRPGVVRTLDPRSVARTGSASYGFQGPFVLALDWRLPMRLGCSSGFRTISRGEPNSMVLWSIMDPGWFPYAPNPQITQAAIRCQTAHPNNLKASWIQDQGPWPCPPSLSRWRVKIR